MEDSLIYDIALSFDESLTPIEKIAFIEKFGSSKEILKLKKNTIKNILGRRWTGNRFNPDFFIEKTKKIMPYMINAGIKTLKFDNPDYPEGLKNIPDYPFLIYYRGNIKTELHKSIAIVGTRNPDNNGLNRAKKFTSSLAKNDFTIISGLAHGIDSASHYNSIINNGMTIAVLGCGIDTIYPHANKKLAQMILEKNGGIISEYPPGIPPKRWNFPKRNRIIVGLSRAVLIIQAPSPSGSLISAMLASDYNRDLFVVTPNNKSEKNDQGNAELIMTGATEVKEPDTIINELRYLVKK